MAAARPLTDAEEIELLALLEAEHADRARSSLVEYCRQITIPGAPVNDEDPDCEQFYPVETEPADHHRLILATMERVARGEIRRVMFLMPPGSAKALALDTPVPTPRGWTTMGELRVGDAVFDEQGRPCRVTWVSPIWRDRPVFVVRTDCGDEIVADAEHEWRVRLCGKPRKPLKTGGRGRPGMSGRDDPATRFKIKETWQIARRRAKRPMIERASALDLPDADLPVDPYLLGVWLGDGHSACLSVTSSVDDQPWLRAELERLGYETRSTSVAITFSVIGVRGKFVALGLVNDPLHRTHGRKHVPLTYLRGSRAQRLALLQGLIDTDGTVCKRRGCTTFCSTNRELADGVRELARSLGVKAGWSEGRAMLYGRDCGPYYRVSFYLAGSARLPRKAALTRNQSRTPDTYVDVRPAGRADTVCIEVDSSSHLFLCGRSMTPTHNSTYASVVVPTAVMGRRPGTNIIGVSYGAELATRIGRRCRAICRSPQYRRIFGAALVDDNRAALDWALTNGSTYMGAGIMGGTTGNRADGLVMDDLLKGRAEADSATIRERVWQEYTGSLRTRLKPGGWIVLITTRWHEDDPAGRILPAGWSGESGPVVARDGEVWHVVRLPAQADRDDDPLGRAPGEWLWPEWFSQAHWEQERRTQGARNWGSLYQQRPTPDEGGIVKRAWVRQSWSALPGETAQQSAARLGLVVFQSWDMNQKASDSSDYTVGQVWGVRWPAVYLLDQVRARMDVPDMLRAVEATSAKWPRATLKLIEEQAGGHAVLQLLRGKLPGLVPVSPDGSKIARLKAVSSMFEAGDVWLPPPHLAPWLGDWIEEVVAFPNVAHDDQADATSQALARASTMRGDAVGLSSRAAAGTSPVAGHMGDR